MTVYIVPQVSLVLMVQLVTVGRRERWDIRATQDSLVTLVLREELGPWVQLVNQVSVDHLGHQDLLEFVEQLGTPVQQVSSSCSRQFQSQTKTSFAA